MNNKKISAQVGGDEACENWYEARGLMIHDDSGNVTSQNKLVHLLYLIMRDHLPPGVLEVVVRDVEVCESIAFSNGWLAKYAMYIAKRLGMELSDTGNKQNG